MFLWLPHSQTLFFHLPPALIFPLHHLYVMTNSTTSLSFPIGSAPIQYAPAPAPPASHSPIPSVKNDRSFLSLFYLLIASSMQTTIPKWKATIPAPAALH